MNVRDKSNTCRALMHLTFEFSFVDKKIKFPSLLNSEDGKGRKNLTFYKFNYGFNHK
jgi:hypothetical protein